MCIISDPVEIFSLFANAYRSLKPSAEISAATHTAIDEIIDDILCEREIAAFTKEVPFKHMSAHASDTGHAVSQHFLDFLHTLEWAMAQQAEFRITPERAIELLYNFDVGDFEWTQPILRLAESHRCAVFSSTEVFDELFGGHVALPVFGLHDATDWTLVA